MPSQKMTKTRDKKKGVRLKAKSRKTTSSRHLTEIERLAREQGVKPLKSIDDLVCWPEDEINDGFEEALAEWRRVDGDRQRR
jgi:hypothetical protein